MSTAGERLLSHLLVLYCRGATGGGFNIRVAALDESPAEGDDAVTDVVERGGGGFVVRVDPAAVHAE